MENFLSSTFESVSTAVLRNELFGSNSTNSSNGDCVLTPPRKSIMPNSPSGLTQNVYEDILNERLHSIRAQESLLAQREMNLKAKEQELNMREQILIERERKLYEDKMELHKVQKIVARKSLPSFERETTPISTDLTPVGTPNSKQFTPVLKKTKRKSLLSMLKFNKTPKEDKARRRMTEVVPSIKGVVKEIMVSDVAENWAPETKKAAFELLRQMNEKGELESVRLNSSISKFKRNKKARRSCYVQGSVRMYG